MTAWSQRCSIAGTPPVGSDADPVLVAWAALAQPSPSASAAETEHRVCTTHVVAAYTQQLGCSLCKGGVPSCRRCCRSYYPADRPSLAPRPDRSAPHQVAHAVPALRAQDVAHPEVGLLRVRLPRRPQADVPVGPEGDRPQDYGHGANEVRRSCWCSLAPFFFLLSAPF